MVDIKKTIEIIAQGTVQIAPEAELEKKLKKGAPLRVKLGMDPTAPDLHLGHTVVLGKLRQLQDLGHHAVLVIGDFTARIGDPTGKSKTRPPLTHEDIANNCKTYFDQVGRILDLTNVSICYNSEWLDPLSAEDIVKLCAKVTLARLTERDDFEKRIKEHQPIGFHELLYPLFQGYDSVALKADIELGGTDQTFNLLMGRYLQEQFDQEPQVIITVPLLEGLDGGPKMSKSLNNAISITESAEQVFGKLMSISDELMWHYQHVLLYKTDDEIQVMKNDVASQLVHPMDVKKKMAHAIVARYWGGDSVADTAQKHFESLFQKKDYSKADEVALEKDTPQPCWIVELLKRLDAVKTSSEAKRLIESGSVHINEQPIRDFKAEITTNPGMVIKVGKHRIYRIK